MPTWLKQAISYVLSFLVYLYFLKWQVALLLVLGITFHEMGHLYMAKLLKVKTQGSIMLPFIGAVSIISPDVKRYSNLSLIIMAGPGAGLLSTMICYSIYIISGSVFWGQSALLLALFNVSNLIPLGMFDGGKLCEGVVNSLNPKWLLYYLITSYILLASVVCRFNPLLLPLVIAFAMANIWPEHVRVSLRRKGLEDQLPPQPQVLSTGELISTVAGWLLLTAALGGFVWMGSMDHLSVLDLLHK